MMSFGTRLKYLRQKQHLTQKDLGMALGFSESTADVRIAQYEAGTRTPRPKLLNHMANVLSVDPIILSMPVPDTEEEFRAIIFWCRENFGNQILAEGYDHQI